MQVTLHQIANQRWTLIWIWRVILFSRFGSVQCHAIYMNNHIFFSSIQQTRAPFTLMKHDVPHCSLMVDSQSSVSPRGRSAALATQSCMRLCKHGLTRWDPRRTGLANQIIDHWPVHKKLLPPYLAYIWDYYSSLSLNILWNCSGVDVNNLESILVMTWHRQGAFQIQ